MKLTIREFYKTSEEDNWQEGCIGNMEDSIVDLQVSADSQKELMEKASEILGSSYNEIDEDDDSKINFETIEDEHGLAATGEEMDQWKQGKLRLWHCTYTAFVTLETPFKLSRGV
tara:strand:- start:7037 stop:7381 length:345 start_codon:yes stop_codon:yes gene_type:complete